MGRARSTNKHLPRRMHLKAGTYWYVYRKDGKYTWEKLGRDFSAALMKWAEIEGEAPKAGRLIEHAIGHYLETEKHRLRPATMQGYQRSAANLIAVFGKMELPDLTTNNVYEYVRRRGNVQANRDKALLSATYTAARSWGWYAGENPCTGVRRNPEHARQRYVTDEEMAQLVAALPAKLGRIARWAYLTGMRLSDILALEIRNGSDAGVQFVTSKTKTRMLIEWTDELRQLWRDAAGNRIGAQPLFPGRGKAHYTVSGFETVWQRGKADAELTDIRFHDLRRKSGSDADTDEAASAMLGHDDVRTTRKHYRTKPRRVKPVR